MTDNLPITPDLTYAREFRDKPLGQHSAGLQRILTVFRGADVEGKLVLVCLQPFERWALGTLTGRRGDGVVLVDDVEFTDRASAEWEVFRRRWERYFGEPLELD